MFRNLRRQSQNRVFHNPNYNHTHHRKNGRARALRLERLEDRCVLSAATVTTALDVFDPGDGLTSLREAIFAANILIGYDEIYFDSALSGQTIQLTQGELLITDGLSINGLGADLLTIDASGSDASANLGDGSRIFNIDSGGLGIGVYISGLTLTGGDTSGSGGAILSHDYDYLNVYNCAFAGNYAGVNGGAISSQSLSVSLSTFSGNSAFRGGGIFSANYSSLSIYDSTIADNWASLGGGIYSDSGGYLYVSRSTISGNNASLAGGGVYSAGYDVQILESTLHANNAGGQGGGLYRVGQNLYVYSSTISGNTANAGGGGIYTVKPVNGFQEIRHSTITENKAATGGGLAVGPGTHPVVLYSTIVAQNDDQVSGSDDIAGKVEASYSLVGDSTGATINDLVGNLLGTSASPIDALLGPLSANGGPTLTHALLIGSPAIDAGDPTTFPGSYDQRGYPFERVENGRGTGRQVDIGAYEVQTGSIQGQKWSDLNGDGIKDPDEPGLAGWTIYIDENRNGVRDVTDGNLEPDDYALGTVLDNIVPGITVSSTYGGAVSAGSPIYGTSTGSLAFVDSYGVWTYNRLRVDFALPANYVSIDAIGAYSYGNYGTIYAYDAQNNYLGGYTTYLGLGEVQTLSISRPTTDIAYVIAGGEYGYWVNLDNLEYSSGEYSTTTDANGNYSFSDLAPGDYVLAEVQQPDWTQTHPSAAIDQLLAGLNDNHAVIAALVPNRFNFSGGATGTNIADGGNDMYDGGNILNTNLATSIPYTNGVVTPSDALFGVGSQYFTVKHPGLFALAASDISIDTFSITGNNGADGFGAADGDVLSTTVYGQQYTIYLKRVHSAGDPSINHIVIVPGDGTGVSHAFPADTNNDLHTLSGLSSVDELYYVLVSRESGGVLTNADVLNIANEFLANIVANGAQLAFVSPGETSTGVDFGNYPHPGSIQGQKWHDFNRDGIKDPGEPGLPGWTIFLDTNNDRVLNEGELSTTTDINGNYSFTGLTPGAYRVAEVQQANWVQSFPLGGDSDVVVFDDPSFVDTFGSSSSESDNVQASLTSLGFTVTTFTGVTGAQWSAALAGGSTLLIPEQEINALAPYLEPAAIAALQTFVASGGGLIINGSGFNAAHLLNTVFGFSLAEQSIGSTTTKTAAAAGTEFADDIAFLNGNNATYGLASFSLPSGALSIYQSGGVATVALMGYGSGQIAYLGYDWFEAAPVGYQDGGWIPALDSAVREVAGPGYAHRVSVGPGEDVFDRDFGNYLLPEHELRGTSFAVTPKNLFGASQTTANFTIENTGYLPTGAFDVRFYLSDDPVIDPNTDIPLSISAGDPNYNPAEPEVFRVTSVAGLNSLSASALLVVPGSDPFATDNDYYIGMFVDADNDVSEDVESNNINLGPGVDLDAVAYKSNIAQVPFLETWESGTFDPWWETISDPFGRIQITNANEPYLGAYHVTMDSTVGIALNQLILHVNLAGRTGVTLEFANKEFADEDHLEDSVQMSVDGGATWHTIVPLRGTSSTSFYTLRVFNLDLLGLPYSSDTQIRFQQYDDFPIAIDGMAFDNIRVTATGSSPSLAGDYTQDGIVDAGDYVFRRKFLGGVGDHDVWQSQFGSALPTGAAPLAAAAPAPMQAFAAFSDDVALGDAAATGEASPLDASFNRLASNSEGHAGGVEVAQTRGEKLRAARGRGASNATVASQEPLDAALRTWLARTQEQGDSDNDAIESKPCESDSARDAYFESFDRAPAGVGGELAGHKVSRRGTRLVAVR